MAGLLVGASEPGPAPKRDPFHHVAQGLQPGRVVGLADFAHHNAYAFHTLLTTLDRWLARAATEGGHLTLALEADPRMVGVLEDFLQSGDLEPVLDYWLPFSTLDQLEFYAELRRFAHRVDASAKAVPGDRRLRFEVLGLEPLSPLSAPESSASHWSDLNQAGDLANARDRHLAQALLSSRKERPSGSVLAFYGTDHLGVRETPQSWARRLFGAAGSWLPLGAILKRELGTNFWSVAQMPFPPEARAPGNPWRSLTGEDILMNASEVPWNRLPQPAAQFDAIIFLHTPRIDEAHLLKFVCSRRVLDRAIERMTQLERIPRTPLVARHPALESSLAALRLTTGRDFQTAAEWKAWAENAAYNGFERIQSADFAEAVRQLCEQPASRSRAALLYSLGLPLGLSGRQQRTDADRWQREIWPQLFPTIQLLQAIGLHWVGYPEERQKARGLLIELSGQDLPTAEAYLKWYRRHRLNLEY